MPEIDLTLLHNRALWVQLAVIAVSAILAWVAHRQAGARMRAAVDGSDRRAARRLLAGGAHRLVFPLTLLLLLLVARGILTRLGHPVRAFDLTVPLMVSLAAIRLAAYLLRKAFRPSAALRAWEQAIGTAAWTLVALHLLGWLPDVRAFLDAAGFQIGSVRISVLSVLKFLVLGALALTVAMWLAGAIERLLGQAQHLSPAARVGVGKTVRFALPTIALVVVLQSVGIDLTALTVFGGALGVGLGFGLQRIASNFISGFILIFDRSIRPGDVISIGDSFGWVRELRARYVVIRNRDGVETLVPNENLITSEVINWSYGDRNVRIKIPVQISYADDPEQAMALMLQAAHAEKRILPEPPPACRLMGFGDNGINLELRVWIQDPEEGVNNVRSDVNLAIWRAFRASGITIPFPQRDVYLKSKG